MTYAVAAYYRFVRLTDLPVLQAQIKEVCLANEVCGTILIAPEGINSTISAPTLEQLDTALDFIDSLAGIRQGELKYSTAAEKPFRRLKVQVKKEIITMKRPEADPTVRTGTYVDPAEWNALMAQDGVLLLDVRNTYETEIGMFKNAIDPQVETFSQLADYIDQMIDPTKHDKVLVYCTGGIRDEKASSYLLHKGVKEAYQLKGGVLKYLETVPEAESQWDGTCFVFDDRQALGHGLSEHKRETRWPWHDDERHPQK
jgi:UPF0176 protein